MTIAELGFHNSSPSYFSYKGERTELEKASASYAAAVVASLKTGDPVCEKAFSRLKAAVEKEIETEKRIRAMQDGSTMRADNERDDFANEIIKSLQ